MKRIAALVLVLALMFSFTACQNGDKNVNANQTAEPVATKTPEEISNAAQEITDARNTRPYIGHHSTNPMHHSTIFPLRIPQSVR